MSLILIVDDDKDFRDTFAALLRGKGHDVESVPNGREALAHVLDNLPAVVMLDLMMPDMDGPSFLEVIRSYLRLQSLPVVVVTGLSDSPMIDRVQALKVNAVLAKGKASPDQIIHALEEAIVHLPG